MAHPTGRSSPEHFGNYSFRDDQSPRKRSPTPETLRITVTFESAISVSRRDSHAERRDRSPRQFSFSRRDEQKDERVTAASSGIAAPSSDSERPYHYSRRHNDLRNPGAFVYCQIKTQINKNKYQTAINFARDNQEVLDSRFIYLFMGIFSKLTEGQTIFFLGIVNNFIQTKNLRVSIYQNLLSKVLESCNLGFIRKILCSIDYSFANYTDTEKEKIINTLTDSKYYIKCHPLFKIVEGILSEVLTNGATSRIKDHFCSRYLARLAESGSDKDVESAEIVLKEHIGELSPAILNDSGIRWSDSFRNSFNRTI